MNQIQQTGQQRLANTAYADYACGYKASPKDPQIPDWKTLQLPNTWPDQFNLANPIELARFFRCILGKRKKVIIPDDLPGKENIPKYALQEFHSLPNGNYSNSLTRGYITGFDYSMLNTVDKAREHLANAVSHAHSVLDLGTAGGKTAAMVKASGVDDVWGLDPSPYLLKHAATDYPDIRFIQGKAEKTGFADQRFEGITACFLMHEIPPRYLEQVINECYRILKPGGILAIAEPSSVQMLEPSLLRLVKSAGLSALYFRWLAYFVFEPFVEAWHKKDIRSWLEKAGFELLEDKDRCPVRLITARKRQS